MSIKDDLCSTLEAPLKYRHCNFLLLRFVHYKLCAKIYRKHCSKCLYQIGDAAYPQEHLDTMP